MFRAIELDAARQRTGREIALEADTRQEAIDLLLRQLDVAQQQAQVDPTRTVVRIEDWMWTIVAGARVASPEAPASLRRAGAKHKRVR